MLELFCVRPAEDNIRNAIPQVLLRQQVLGRQAHPHTAEAVAVTCSSDGVGIFFNDNYLSHSSSNLKL